MKLRNKAWRASHLCHVHSVRVITLVLVQALITYEIGLRVPKESGKLWSAKSIYPLFRLLAAHEVYQCLNGLLFLIPISLVCSRESSHLHSRENRLISINRINDGK